MSKLLSFLFHPFYFVLLGIFIFFNTNTYINFGYSRDLKLFIYAVVFLNTMLLPTLIGAYLNNRGQITSIHLDTIRDRKIMYVITFAFYVATLFVLTSFNVPTVVYRFALGASLTVAALFVLALFNKKVSAHMSAIGGICGSLVMLTVRLQTDFLNLIFVFFLLAGIVGAARIEVGAHREREVYLGFLLGFLAQVFIFF